MTRKQIKQSYRGITWQPIWEWRPPPPHYQPLEWVPFEPEKHIKGYAHLEYIKENAYREMARYQKYVAYEAAVMTTGLRDKTKADYLAALEAYERANEILEQVYEAYTGTDETFF